MSSINDSIDNRSKALVDQYLTAIQAHNQALLLTDTAYSHKNAVQTALKNDLK
jgi:hypothetical protein